MEYQKHNLYMHLNTSYVEVKQVLKWVMLWKEVHLNTSYVEVKHIQNSNIKEEMLI